jgi:cell cycle checkpoint protein
MLNLASASMAPPAKRRKRNILPSSSTESDHDDDQSFAGSKAQIAELISPSPMSPRISQTHLLGNPPDESNNVPSKPLQRVKTAKYPHNAAPINFPTPARGRKLGNNSSSSSPEKPRRKVKNEDKLRSGDISTFFTKQAQRQQAEGGGKTAETNPKLLSQISKDTCVKEDDLISDDDVLESKPIPSSFVRQAVKKRSRGTDAFKDEVGGALSSSQKFVLKSKDPVNIKSVDDMRPWAERFAPINLDELAVHKRKVADVRGWLEDVTGGRMRQRLLVLKGNAGTGKTTTLQLLANAMDCDVLEWRNPIGSVATSEGYQSMAAQFEEFMVRVGKFGQLAIHSGDGKASSNLVIKPLDRRKQIILVEEFPNTFTRLSTALQSFRNTIIQYLASNTPPLSMGFTKMKKDEPITPVVIIISETLLATSSASADSFTAHRLLGPEILQHPGVGIIEFNAIAPTLLAKGLELVVQKESRQSGRRKTPGPQVLKKLGEIGDIRSAIGSLEFMCVRGDLDGDWGAKVAFGKTKKIPKNAYLTKMEEDSLELITRREASLGIFHAVGKVVYNKREDFAGEPENLPTFMSLNSRPKRSEVLVDELMDETGTDTQTFVAALHENYLLSCDASSTEFGFSSLDHVNGCIDSLSDSDLLCPAWNGSFNTNGFSWGRTGGQGSGGDILRQDEISFQIAVRGILFSLPYPVGRKAPASGANRTGKVGDAFKMFYPTSLKLWRIKEDIESAIDLWVTRLIKGGDEQLSVVSAEAAAFMRPKPGTVESWKKARESDTLNQESTKKDDTQVVTITARKEMLLERLPYMVAIARGRKTSCSALAIRGMEKVTSFHGIGGSSEETDDGDDTAVVGEEWATDKSMEGTSPKKKALVVRGRDITSGLSLQQPEHKLFLSDDDIDDD